MIKIGKRCCPSELGDELFFVKIKTPNIIFCDFKRYFSAEYITLCDSVKSDRVNFGLVAHFHPQLISEDRTR